MDILYSRDMRNVTVYAVRTGRAVRWIASTTRNPPEDWEVEALRAKRRRSVEGIDWWWRYLGVAPENVVTCRLREPVGGDPTGKYPIEELRLVVRGPEQVLVFPYPANDAEWRDLFLWTYTTMLDAAIYRESRRRDVMAANRRWRKRVAERKKAKREAVPIPKNGPKRKPVKKTLRDGNNSSARKRRSQKT